MSRDRGFIIAIGGAEEKIRNRLILRRFVEECGGENARIAIIPTASRLKKTARRYEESFKDLGVRSTHSLPFETRADCKRDDWLEVLEEADGVFLTGGNQLRLSTTLGGTPVSAMLRRRNETGLHVAGTSAGAAFVSEHMIAFGNEGPTPHANMVALAPGLGLIEKVIVDQHFRQRDRLGRLLSAISYNPHVIGIGLDEDTAAFIGPDEVLEVVGTGALTILDPTDVEYSSMDSATRKAPVSLIGLRLHVLVAGGTFNLSTRKAQPATVEATTR